VTTFVGAESVRVSTDAPLPHPEVVARLRRGSASLIVDQGDGCLWLAAELVRLGDARHGRLCGPVLTVNAPPGDNVAVRIAFDRVQPGQVIMIAGKGYLGRALIGEILARQAIARGAAGFVIDGAVRDLTRLAELPVPVYCRGSALQRATKAGRGEVGFPVAFANEVVYSGDVVVADEDGIALVRREAAERVAALIEPALAYEANRIRSADDGRLDLGVGTLAAEQPIS
jgi:regulator of RNase E activity RraA